MQQNRIRRIWALAREDKRWSVATDSLSHLINLVILQHIVDRTWFVNAWYDFCRLGSHSIRQCVEIEYLKAANLYYVDDTINNIISAIRTVRGLRSICKLAHRHTFSRSEMRRWNQAFESDPWLGQQMYGQYVNLWQDSEDPQNLYARVEMYVLDLVRLDSRRPRDWHAFNAYVGEFVDDVRRIYTLAVCRLNEFGLSEDAYMDKFINAYEAITGNPAFQ